MPEMERQSSLTDMLESRGALRRSRLAALAREAAALASRCESGSARPRAVPPPPPPSAESLAMAPFVAPFVRLSLDADDAAFAAFIADVMARGFSVQAVYLHLLAPAARALGEMWTADDCDFVEVTLGVARLQLALRDLSSVFLRESPAERAAGRVLLTGGPGEQHSLGLFMVAEFFVRDGWEVRVGSPVAMGDLLSDVGAAWYDVVGFSMSCDSSFDRLKRVVTRVRRASRNSGVLIMAGGRAFDEQPDLLRRIGADMTARTAEMAPVHARQVLALALPVVHHAPTPAVAGRTNAAPTEDDR